jgi:molybdate transport system permease protein
MNDLASSLLYSLMIAIPATLLATLVGVPAAYVARRDFRGKSLLEAAVIVPLVLPPTVVGYLIVVLMGRNGWLGQWIASLPIVPTRELLESGSTIVWKTGYTILFRPEGGILAGAVVALPLLYLPAKAAFAGVEREMEDVARLNGANRWDVFWLVSLPIAWRGVASGLVLAFARALGEFGATVMVMGHLSGRSMTLPLLVYDFWEQGELHAATAPVLLLSAIALLLAVLFNRIPRD